MITGWWYTDPSEKNEFVIIPTTFPTYGKIKAMFQTTNQLGKQVWIIHHLKKS
jgi:hypothetical protein